MFDYSHKQIQDCAEKVLDHIMDEYQEESDKYARAMLGRHPLDPYESDLMFHTAQEKFFDLLVFELLKTRHVGHLIDWSHGKGTPSK